VTETEITDPTLTETEAETMVISFFERK